MVTIYQQGQDVVVAPSQLHEAACVDTSRGEDRTEDAINNNL